jgi:antitoxin YefM
MIAVNFSSLRDSLKKYCDKVYQDSEPIIITRRNNENVVLISENEYNNLMENAYIRKSPANYKRLLESIEQLKDGKIKKVDISYE